MGSRKIIPIEVTAVAPCRVDCGGTLDIMPLTLGLSPHKPCSLNIALDIPTRVTIRKTPGSGLLVKSAGFKSEKGTSDTDYTSPLGFFFQAADHFGLNDLEISIESSSPPRSALGGSSVALTAAVSAMAQFARRRMNRAQIVLLAHKLEEALFRTSCGTQDHLAAAYGGVNLWTFTPSQNRLWKATKLIKGSSVSRLEKRMLIVYPGQAHDSADINDRWIEGFVTGQTRPVWRKIIEITRKLAENIANEKWIEAGNNLRKETELRLSLTPEVMTETGLNLFEEACRLNVGARFSGAGGGGCLWALGKISNIEKLVPVWQEIISTQKEARLLPAKINRHGLKVTVKS